MKRLIASRSSLSRRSGRKTAAFTLIEVMIAMGIFFLSVFAILGLVSANLRNARALQNKSVDPSMLLAQLSLTNQLSEGGDSGDFGELYPGYRWQSEITLITNGLFQVEYRVTGPMMRSGDQQQSHMTALMWRPNSPVMGVPGAPPIR